MILRAFVTGKQCSEMINIRKAEIGDYEKGSDPHADLPPVLHWPASIGTTCISDGQTPDTSEIYQAT